jgi:hypothetical protein
LSKVNVEVFALPSRRVSGFVNRPTISIAIEQKFGLSRTVILKRMGGQGKTQLALEYYHHEKSHFLITSRHADSSRLGTLIEVGGMTEGEAMDLWFGAFKQINQKPIWMRRGKLRRLGYHPLANDQTGAYIGSSWVELKAPRTTGRSRRNDAPSPRKFGQISG